MSAKGKGRFARPSAIIGTLAFAALIAAAAVWWYSGKSVANPPMVADHSTPVSVAAATPRDVPVYLSGLGTVQATNTVSIHTQVNGTLQTVNFVEGQEIHAGDVLAQIDSRVYQAALDQAKGRLAEDQAQLIGAQKDLARFRALVTNSFETVQNLDHQTALVGQLQATIQVDQATIESAQTQLDYTTIKSPIEARTGIRQVDPGNFVQTSDTAPIVILTEVKPISVLFSLPESDTDSVRRALLGGDVEVTAYDANNQKTLATGKALLIDNVANTATGTITIKATFPNADEALWPGQFVNARLLLETQKGALTIPTAAVQRGPDGLYAWVVASDGRARMRPLQGGPEDGDLTVVASGLDSGDRVVTGGQSRLQEGTAVTISPAALAASGPGTAGGS
jgi:multidrug efflux system membrane fusion protein